MFGELTAALCHCIYTYEDLLHLDQSPNTSHRCKCSGTRLLSAGLAQQHRRTRQAVYPKHCTLVFGDCKQMQAIFRCKLSAGLAQTLQQCTGLVTAHLYDLGVTAVDCCQLVWHSSTLCTGVCSKSKCRLNPHRCKRTGRLLQLVWHNCTEEQGRQFTLNQLQQCTGV